MSWDRLANQLGASAKLSGILVPQLPMGSATSGIPSASTTTYQRFVAPRTFEVDSIFFRVQAADPADVPIEVAIYDANTLAKVATSGVVSGKFNGATGRIQVDLTSPYQLVGGQVYYAAISIGAGGSTGTISFFLLTNAGIAEWAGAAAPNKLASAQGVTPAPATANVGGNVTQQPILFLRERGT